MPRFFIFSAIMAASSLPIAYGEVSALAGTVSVSERMDHTLTIDEAKNLPSLSHLEMKQFFGSRLLTLSTKTLDGKQRELEFFGADGSWHKESIDKRKITATWKWHISKEFLCVNRHRMGTLCRVVKRFGDHFYAQPLDQPAGRFYEFEFQDHQ